MKKVVLCLIAVVAISMAAVPALADTAYNNLGTPPSYNCCAGWTVGGVSSPVGLVEDGEQFTSLATGSVNQIDVAVGWVVGTNALTVQLWTSVGDLPGTMLGSGTVTGLRLLEARFRQLQAAFTARRVGWFAEFLRTNILGDLHEELAVAAGLGDTPAYRDVLSSIERLGQLAQR